MKKYLFIVLFVGFWSCEQKEKPPVLSYGLSAFTQIKQNSFQIKQLESCLVEIEENTIAPSSIKKYKTKRIKNIVTIGIALIIGVILLLFLVFELHN